MKKFSLLTIVAVCITVISMIGCGSDSATESNLIIGDTSSASFQFVADSIGTVSSEMAGNGLDLSFELLEMQFPSAAPSKIAYTKATADTVIVISNNYSYSNGWHIFDYAATFVEFSDTTIVEGIDSIQTLVNNTPVALPDSTMNGIKIRAQYAFQNNTFGSGVGHQSFDLSATTFDSLGVVTINGNTNDTLTATYVELTDTCSLDMNNTLTITNLVFVIDALDDCITSGQIVGTQNIMLNCIGGQGSSLDSLNIDGTWTITITFNGTSEIVTYSDGTTTWSVTETCGPTAIGAKLGKISSRK